VIWSALISILAEVRIPAGVLREKTTELIREAAATAAPESSSILGIGLETALSAAAGGGAVALGIGGVRLVSYLLSKKKKDEGSTAIARSDPFPRRLDEARQLREMAFISERRVPEYDAAVGRIVSEELTVRLANADQKEREILNDFWGGCRDRVDRLMPPSTIEYRKKAQ
jgi:hypothetical protein